MLFDRIADDPSASADDGSEYLSEEQRQFLENSIKPDAFLEQLQNDGNEFFEIVSLCNPVSFKTLVVILELGAICFIPWSRCLLEKTLTNCVP